VDPKPFRLAVWLVLMIGFGILLHDSESWYTTKNLAVGRDGDRIYAFDPRFNPSGQEVSQALAWIEQHVPRDATLAVLPEGTIINYLSRRVNRTGYPVWMPPELQTFGEANMVAAFQQHPPDYICLVKRDVSEYGIGTFGDSPADGLELMQWIEKNYQPVYLIGHEPLSNGLFGVEILKRLPSR